MHTYFLIILTDTFAIIIWSLRPQEDKFLRSVNSEGDAQIFCNNRNNAKEFLLDQDNFWYDKCVTFNVTLQISLNGQSFKFLILV